MLEIVLTSFLMLVVLSVTTGAKEKGITAGIAIGAVIALEAMFAGPICGASMNPVRSLAPGARQRTPRASLALPRRPVLGALLAVPACIAVREPGCCTAADPDATRPMPMTAPLVLILCTGNSCRSHLAEGILRAAAGDAFRVASAGSKPAGYVHPLAIQAMAEIGIDISAHHSKHLDEFLSEKVETVITVCGNADQVCPMFPGQVNRHHWGFDDPAHATGTEDEQLAVFRRVRDEITRIFEAYAAGRLDEARLRT